MYVAFIGGLACCISKLRQSIPVPRHVSCSCNCKGECKCECKQIRCIAILGALYDSICALIECDKLDRASEVIAYLQRYCDSNCTGC